MALQLLACCPRARALCEALARDCASCDELSEKSKNWCHLSKLIPQNINRLSLGLGALPSSHRLCLRHQNGFTLVLSDGAGTKS